MKWIKNAKQGIVVAGGQGAGYGLGQLSGPRGLFVDRLGSIYVVDEENHRVMRWYKEATTGSVIVGGRGKGTQCNQLSGPLGLTFDKGNNLYIADYGNHRIQRFTIE